MHLIYHGHLGQRHVLRARAPNNDDVAQHDGQTPYVKFKCQLTSLILDIHLRSKTVWMQGTRNVQEMLVPDVTLSAYKTRLIARLVQRQEGKIYWPIFQLAELVFFRASTGPEED